MVKKPKSLSPLIMVTLAVVVLAVGVYAWTNTHDKQVSEIPITQPATPSSSTSSGQTNSSKSTSSTGYISPKEAGPSSAGGSLIIPSGTLVSNHRPSLAGSTSPSAEQSVCNTSPNTSCYIEFTLGDVVKKLPTQTTNGDGSTFWTWDVKQAGLSTGSWRITAVATSNGDTKTFSDSLALEVQP